MIPATGASRQASRNSTPTTIELSPVRAPSEIPDKNGNLPGGDRALIADAIATCCGACMGTSTVTTFVEPHPHVAVHPGEVQGGHRAADGDQLTALPESITMSGVTLAPVFLKMDFGGVFGPAGEVAVLIGHARVGGGADEGAHGVEAVHQGEADHGGDEGSAC